MSAPPSQPRIYHITHVDNLVSIARDGVLLSDAMIAARGGPAATIGMSSIKRRRMEELEVTCHRGTKVGQCVPFYFCPRSVMLYLIYRGNNPDLAYKGGQDPIVHLECDLYEAIRWADSEAVPWAFSLSNAGAYYAVFENKTDRLDQINWAAVQATDWRSPDVKEGKQAEFLINGSFPWKLVSRVGVKSMGMRDRVRSAIVGAPHQPRVDVVPDWYY